jgi:hypothetical protein
VSRYLSWLFSISLLFAASLAFAADEETKKYTCESPKVQTLMADLGSDSTCHPEAWTAFSKLPAVRMVVFDPISKSFSFTTCSDNVTSNEEILDRRRLALATQRIRLLILPYNPAEGDIQVEIVEGKGTEFPATSVTGTAPVEEKKDTKEEKPPVQKPPEGSSADQAREVATDKSNSKSRSAIQSFSQSYRLAPEQDQSDVALSFGENATDPLLLLTIISERFDSYNVAVNKFWIDLGTLRSNAGCIDRHLGDQEQSLSVALTDGQMWTPARDNRLCTVIAEALRRRDRIVADGYKVCSKPPAQSFEDDFQSLATELAIASGSIASLPSGLKEIERFVDRLESIDPAPLSSRERSQLVKTFRRELADDNKYIEDLRAELKDIKKISDGALDKRSTFKIRQGSQAANLRRENYQPIDNGNMRTFKVNRIEKDGHRSDLPIAQLVLRSAPVDNIRFGMGLVVSQLEDPKFKVGPVTTKSETSPSASAAEDDTTQQKIFFDDENGGRVLPVVLVHNYWLRRSPLLVPTKFERWTPTFSLGIPLAKADPLTQILLGLDWELTPGIEINAGLHFGKVNRLVEGYKVGDLLGDVELTSIQKTTFKTDYYFGLVVNATTFRTLMDSRQDQK